MLPAKDGTVKRLMLSRASLFTTVVPLMPEPGALKQDSAAAFQP